MHQEQVKRILVGLESHSLTSTERRFVELTAEFINGNGTLTEEQDPALKGIHREKKRWKTEVNNLSKPPGTT